MSNGVNTNKWLIASVAINLIFIGALLGDWFSHARRNPPPMHWATGELDEPSRAAVKRILDQKKPVVRALRQEMRAIDKALMEIVRSPTLDATELERILTVRQSKQMEYQSLLQTSLESILPALTPPQRLAVLRRMLMESKPPRPLHNNHAGRRHDEFGAGDRPSPPP
jgi:uncharacterized membrane protein